MAGKNKDQWMMYSYVLLVVGGLNWGLIGLFGFNFVEVVLGGSDILVRLVYLAVGLAALHAMSVYKEMTK